MWGGILPDVGAGAGEADVAAASLVAHGALCIVPPLPAESMDPDVSLKPDGALR